MYPSTILSFLLVALLCGHHVLPGFALGVRSNPRQDHETSSSAEGIPLSGTVADISGAAIAGATLLLEGPGGKFLRSAQSDRGGSFVLTGLERGQYQLTVSSPGFAPAHLRVRVSSDTASAPLRIALAVASVDTAVSVNGREDDLTGIADSATQGTIGAGQIAARPLLRSGEILEAIPGVMVTQHAGGGKANQYFLRGFNLDHGTDFAIFLDGMPLNLPSHAHGEGYADMNTVVPELVQKINFEKGPYDAGEGNYSSAGSAHLDFYKTLPHPFLQLEGGMFGFGRLVFGTARPVGSGNLLLGGEAFHDDGPWVHPDNYSRLNGLLTWSRGDAMDGIGATARAYAGRWHSSDQIPVTAVPLVSLLGTLNPTDGGQSQRYSLQAARHRQSPGTRTAINVYGFYYTLDLFSDFTYFLTDPEHGDQFQQQDRRWVGGFSFRHTIVSTWLGHRVENTVGLQLRNDWIHNGLFQTQNRVLTEKVDVDTATSLPGTTQSDRFDDLQIGGYAENRVQWAAKVRSVVGLRGDGQRFHVHSLLDPANSGTAAKVLPSPKASLIFGPWRRTELYAQAGFSFHSNDGRGTTLTVEPVSAENPFPNTPATPIPALIPTRGGEFGLRSTALAHLQSTLSVWYLHSASELQQSGDTGGTVASPQPSDRYGFEWANFYTPSQHLAFDLDLADSKALFAETDADDAAPDSPGGRRVPEAVGWVIASGITARPARALAASLRLRHFGPRDLTSDGLFRSKATVLLNARLEYGLGESWSVAAEGLNLLNRRDHDIDYAYASRITPTAAPAFTDVFHPVEPFQVRFWLRKTF